MALDDFERPGGLTRRRQYGAHSLAILDASSDVMAANWSTYLSPRRFLSALDSLSDFANAEVIADMSKPELVRMSLAEFRDYMQPEIEVFDQMCRFLRVDISASRSVFWQVLGVNMDHDSYEADAPRFAGIGDETSRFVEQDDGLARYLIAETAAHEINPSDILSDLEELPRRYYRGHHK